ncbi:MAG: hypothetical protein L0287_37140, partial [Anaerolineae bacterium]|nr:hypothetical protein [Anaerolineae bacterium]
LETYLEYYQQAKHGLRRKRKRDAILKRRIWALREKYHHCCGQKIQYFCTKNIYIPNPLKPNHNHPLDSFPSLA